MSDSIIYEAQPIPPEDPKDRSRQQRVAIIGAISLVVLILGGVALGATVFRGNDEPPLAEETTTTSTLPPTLDNTTTPAPLGSFRSQAGSEDSSEYTIAPRGEPTPPLPEADFNWERIVLDLDSSGMAYIQQVVAVEDGFLALGTNYDDQTGTQEVNAWASPDGVEWTRQSLDGDFTNSNVWQFFFNEHGGIALGDTWEVPIGNEGPYYAGEGAAVVWTSADGSTWNRSEFPRSNGPNEYAYLNSGVAGPDGFVVFGRIEKTPDYPPILIEQGGLTLELSNQDNSYRVLDAAGTVLASGSQTEIYRYDEENEGQGVFDPVTHELIVVVPYEIWEQAFADAYEGSASGPFGGYNYEPVDVVIEHDGYRITITDEEFYQVESIATGELIVDGNAEDLWQGPPPLIADAEGNVLMSFTWDEFHQAQEGYWEDFEEPFYDYTADTVVFFSSDGIDWEQRVVGSGAVEANIDSVTVTDAGYLAIGYSYDRASETRQVWESTDGLNWAVSSELPSNQYLWNTILGSDGTLLAFGDTGSGQAVWASDDGSGWREVLGARVPEDENAYEWFNWLASGELGTVVVGNREHGHYQAEMPPPLTITQNEYTLTFDDYDWPPRVTVVDNLTGDTVIDERLGDDEQTSLPEGFYYEDGVTIIENNDTVLMTISDEEFDAAQQARWAEEAQLYEPATPTMYFSTDLDEWFEVSLAGVVDGYVNHVAVGTDAVVLASQTEGDHMVLLEEGSTLADDIELAPSELVIYVGRPQ